MRDALDLLERERRLAGELARPGQRGVEQLVVGHDAVDEPELVRLLGGDRVAGRVHLQRLGRADEPREPLRAAEAGDDPEVDLGLPERGGERGEPDVAGHRQLAAAAEREAVDGGDRHRPRALHRAQQRVHRGRSAPGRPPRPSAVNDLMSAPAQNSAGFGEARMTAPTLPSTSRQACSSASITAGESELAGGLSSHRTATSSPRRSSLTGRGLVARLGLRVRVEALAALRRRGGPGRPAGAAGAAARSARPTRPRRRSSAASTSSSPRKSARANGPGTMPVPIIRPRSISRTPAMPSSSTRQASTSALSVKRSAIALVELRLLSGAHRTPSRSWRRGRRARSRSSMPLWT